MIHRTDALVSLLLPWVREIPPSATEQPDLVEFTFPWGTQIRMMSSQKYIKDRKGQGL